MSSTRLLIVPISMIFRPFLQRYPTLGITCNICLLRRRRNRPADLRFPGQLEQRPVEDFRSGGAVLLRAVFGRVVA
jgi:hypothetical protein